MTEINRCSVSYEEAKFAFKYDPLSGIITWANRVAAKAVVGRECGTIAQNGYRYINFRGWKVLAHRLAWFLTYQEWPEGFLDHINGVKTDNRICNLRKATNAQNTANGKKRTCNSSGHVGVSWDKEKQKWFAKITKDGKQMALGRYKTVEEAAEAYQRAAKELHGEFHRVGA